MLRNDPAFPIVIPDQANSTCDDRGLSKRELFAALAMQGLLVDDDDTPSDTAARAVEMADALLAALAEPRKETP